MEGSIHSYDKWLTLRNNTIFEKVEVDFIVPKNATTEAIDIEFIFKDDHRATIARSRVYVRAYVTAIEEDYDEFDFEDYIDGQRGNQGQND